MFLSLQGYSCVDLQNGGMRHSGVYYLQIRGTTYWFLKVFCDQDIADGGWTVSESHIPIQAEIFNWRCNQKETKLNEHCIHGSHMAPIDGNSDVFNAIRR